MEKKYEILNHIHEIEMEFGERIPDEVGMMLAVLKKELNRLEPDMLRVEDVLLAIERWSDEHE